MTPRTAEYMISVRAARVSWARMKWASIWFRSLSTFSRNSRCGRDWMVESRKSLKARPSFRKKIDNSGTTKNSHACLATSATRNPMRCASSVMSSLWLTRNDCTRSVDLCVPAVFCAELSGDLAGTELRQQGGQGLSQLRAFARHLRTHRHKEHDDQHEQQDVDHGDGPSAPAQDFFQPVHQRAHQVGEEDGEQKGDQGGPGHVEKPQPQREQQHRDQSPRRS